MASKATTETRKVHKLKTAVASNGDGDGDGEREELTKNDPEQGEFEGMETPRIPKLELKAKEIAKRETSVKKWKKEIDELKDEAAIIMQDHEIDHYHKYGVHLDIERDRKLKVSID